MHAMRFVLVGTLVATLAACATATGGTSPAPAAHAGASAAASPVATIPASGPAATLADFSGPWAGHTEKGTPVERAATLLIEPDREGGFTVRWASFEAGETAGSVVQRERSMRFLPTAESGIWLAEAPSADPFAHLAGWARIVGDTLRIDTLGLRRDGQLELQVYDRTLNGGGALRLTYRRFVEGDLRRTIEADFLRL